MRPITTDRNRSQSIATLFKRRKHTPLRERASLNSRCFAGEFFHTGFRTGPRKPPAIALMRSTEPHGSSSAPPNDPMGAVYGQVPTRSGSFGGGYCVRSVSDASSIAIHHCQGRYRQWQELL